MTFDPTTKNIKTANKRLRDFAELLQMADDKLHEIEQAKADIIAVAAQCRQAAKEAEDRADILWRVVKGLVK